MTCAVSPLISRTRSHLEPGAPSHRAPTTTKGTLMSTESIRPSAETVSKALGAFSTFNTPALELAITSALMRNESILPSRPKATVNQQDAAPATA